MSLPYSIFAQKYRELKPDADEDEIKRGYNTEGYGTVEAFGEGIQSGFHQTLGGFGTLGDMVGLPTKEWAESQYAKAEQYALPEHLQGRVWDNPGLMADPRWLAHTTGQVIPSLAATIGPGAAAYKGAQLAKLSPKAAQMAAAGVSGVMGGSLEAAGTYRQTESVPQALAMGGASAVLNMLPAYKLFGPVGKFGLPGKMLATGASEAITEWAEEPVEALITGQDVTEAAKAGLNVMPGSFLATMLLGGGGAMAQSLTKKQAEQKPTTAQVLDYLESQGSTPPLSGAYPQMANVAQSYELPKTKTDFKHIGKKVVGAPGDRSDAVVAATIDSLEAPLHNPANQTPEITDWYENAGEMIRNLTHGDQRLSESIVRLTAMLSPQNEITENWKAMVETAYEMATGNITRHHLKMLPSDFKRLLNVKTFDKHQRWVGNKVQNFYRNLSDTTFQKNEFPNAVTLDMWMARKVGYKGDQISDTKYEFLTKALVEATDRYNEKTGQNLLPRQAQARIWAETRRPTMTAGQVMSFTEAGRRATQNVTYETVPSTQFADGQRISKMSQADKADFTRRSMALLTENGQDALLKKMGIPLYHQRAGTGGYDGGITPNVINGVQAIRINGTYDNSYVGAYARALQYIFRQDAVPWFRADPTLDVNVEGNHEGVYLKFEKPLDAKAEETFFADLRDVLGEDAGYTKLAPNEVAVVDFADQGDVFLENIDSFLDKYSQALTITPETVHFVTEGDYPYHDWKQDKEGTALRAEIQTYQGRSPGSPDLLEWLDGRREAFDSLAENYQGEVKKYNITSEQVDAQIMYANRIDEIKEWGVKPPVPLEKPTPLLLNLIDGFDNPYFKKTNSYGSTYNKLTGTEVNIVAAAINNIVGAGISGEALGNIEAIVSFDPKQGEEGNMAYFVPRNGMGSGNNPPYLAISTQSLSALQATNSVTLMKNIRWTLAHELGHALDIGSNPDSESLTAYSDLFDIDPFKFEVVEASGTHLGGKTKRVTGKAFSPIMDEMIRAFESKAGAKDGFTTMMLYPLVDVGHMSLRGMEVVVSTMFGDIEMTSSQLRDIMRKVQLDNKGTIKEKMIAMDMAASYADKVMEIQQELTRVKAEVFAQMHAMYYIAPKLLKKHAPTAFKFVEELVGYGNQGLSVGDFNTAIRKHFQAKTRAAYSDERGAPKWAIAWNGDTGGALIKYAAATRGARQSTEGGPKFPRVRWEIKSEKVVGIPPTQSQMEKPAGVPPGPPQGEPEVTKIAREQGGREATEASRRRVQTWEATTHLANVLGTSTAEVEKFLRRKFGTAFNAEQLHQSAAMVEQEWTEKQAMFKQLNEKMNKGDLSDVDMAEAYEAILSLNSMNAQFMGIRAEAGRALQIFRKLQDTVGLVKAISQETNKKGGRAMLKAQIALLAEMDKPGAGMRAARDVLKITTWDKFLEYYTAALVSGLPTHVVNSVSNTAMQILEDMSRAVASVVGGVMGSKDRVTMGEWMARMSGYTAGSRMGLQAFWEMTKDEDAQMESMPVTRGLVKAEGRHPHAIGGLLGKGIRIPFRFLGAEDMFFKSLTVGKELAGLAYTESQATGVPMAEILNNPSQEMLNKANEEAARITFTEQAGPISQMMTRIGTEFPAFRVIAPFIRTPGNLIKQGLKHSLAAPLFSSVRADIRKGGRTRDIAVARIITGTTLSATAISLAMAGLLTGSPPEDPNERRLWYQQGFQANSIKIGDTWVSYSRLEPFGMLLGIAADMHTFSTKIGTDEASELAALLTSSVMSNLTSKTYLRGVSEVIAAINEPERYGERWLQRLGATVATPTFLAYTAKATDDRLRKAETLIDQIKSRVPGMRTTLPERLDIFGETIMEQGSGMYRFFSPAYLKKAKHEPVAKELMAHDVSFPAVPKKFRGVELDVPQYNSLVEAVGKPTYKALQQVVKSQRYKELPDPLKKWVLQKVTDTVRRNARLYWAVGGHPEILREAEKLKQEKIYGTEL